MNKIYKYIIGLLILLITITVIVLLVIKSGIDDLENEKYLIINQKELSLKIGKTYQLNASIYSNDNINEQVLWESSDSNILYVNEKNGFIEARKKGVAIVKAKIENNTDSCIVSVGTMDIPIETISFTSEEINIITNENYQLEYTVLPKNATMHEVSYIVSDESILTVDDKGMIKGKKAGKAVVTVISKNYNVYDEVIVSVFEKNNKNNLDIEKIEITNNNITINKGGKITLNTEILPNESLKKITWKSTNNDIVQVDKNGIITGINNGLAYVIATSVNGKSDIVKVNVENRLIRVKKINIENKNIELKLGEEKKIDIIITPNNASNQDLIWESTNNEVVEVLANGVIKGLKTGNSVIKVKTMDGKYSDSVNVTVSTIKNPTYEMNINIISNDNISLNVNESKNLMYKFIPVNATYQNVIWNSSNDDVVTVLDGMIYGKSVGKATISVSSLNNKKDSVTVEVKKVDVSSITLNEKTITIKENETYAIIPILKPINATDKKINWSSDNEVVAKVDSNGIVTGKSGGKAIITATTNDGNLSDTFEVIVDSDNILINKIEFENEIMYLKQGDQKELKPIITPIDAKNTTLSWKSSNEEILTVDENGKLFAKNVGEAIVTVNSDNNISNEIKISIISVKTVDEMCEFIKSSGASSFSYEDFREFYKNNTDDYYLIKQSHLCANKLNIPIKLESSKTYNIYNTKNEGHIDVKTSVDFNNSTIYIHDEKDIVYKDAAYQSIFYITNFQKDSTITLSKSKIASLKGKIKKGVKKISELAGYGNALVEVSNDNQKMFYRIGYSESSAVSQKDYFTIDNDGNVNEDIIWNFQDITSVVLNPISSDRLKFENATINTIVDPTNYSNKQEVTYVVRGIEVKRSNVEINNISHTYVNTNKKSIDVMSYSYNGFITMRDIANVNITNVKLHAMKSTNPLNLSTYDLNFSHAVNITLTNVRTPEYQLTNGSWKVTGTNRTKNIVYDNCCLNGYDSHQWVHNLTVKNSLIGDNGVVVLGSGKLIIENCVIKGIDSIVVLRYDYGSHWDGEVIIENCKFYPIIKDKYVRIINVQLIKKNYDFGGYYVVWPNVYINNLTVYNNIKTVYVYSNDENRTGISNGNLYTYMSTTGNKLGIPKVIQIKNVVDGNGSPITAKKYYYSF